MKASLESVYITYEYDHLHKKRNFVLTKSLPSKWEDDFSFYPDGQFISYIESDSEYEIFESDNPTPHNPFKWCCTNMVVGGTAMFEKQGMSLELVSNFKSTLHMTCLSDSECVNEADVPSDARFIVRYHDQLDDSDHLILLKKLPTSWCDEVPVYQLKDYVWDLNEDNKYTIEGPYGTIGSAYDWGVSTLGVGYVAGFKVKGDTLKFEEIYSRPFVTEDTVTHIGGKIAYLSKDTHGSIVDEVNESVDQPLSDNVNHPSHYTSHPSGVECIEITKHHDFCIGNAIKYLWRQGLKQDAGKSVKEKRIEDLKKAAWYINAEIDLLENDRQGSEL